ncbi:MAG TPA: hypothetical protein VNS62_08990, partial [Candidatus Udaeobacter sp.]|nr:hypothetical protein [Candidatus Udaeobacter sp.]
AIRIVHGQAAVEAESLLVNVAEQVEALRANIAETLLVPLIKEQGGKEIQHEKRENIFAGPVRRWH